MKKRLWFSISIEVEVDEDEDENYEGGALDYFHDDLVDVGFTIDDMGVEDVKETGINE